MKAILLIGSFALLLPALATASAPIDAAVLGQIEAKRDFCERVDPSGSKDRAGFINALMGQFSTEDLQATRESEAYKSAYGETRSHLGELDTKSASSACSVGAR